MLQVELNAHAHGNKRTIPAHIQLDRQFCWYDYDDDDATNIEQANKSKLIDHIGIFSQKSK